MLYHLLKHAESNDADCDTRSHAQAALGEFDTKIKQFLFPASSLTKTNISAKVICIIIIFLLLLYAVVLMGLLYIIVKLK